MFLGEPNDHPELNPHSNGVGQPPIKKLHRAAKQPIPQHHLLGVAPRNLFGQPALAVFQMQVPQSNQSGDQLVPNA